MGQVRGDRRARLPLEVAFVDVGGTLISEVAWRGLEVGRIRRRRLLEAGIPPDRVDALMEQLGQAEDQAERSTYYEIHDLLRTCLATAGLDTISAELVRRAWVIPAQGTIPLLPGAGDLLQAARAAGLRCHLLTNTFVRRADEAAEDWRAEGLDHLIDGIVSSVDTLWRKPDRHIFEAALAAAGTVAEHAVMIGNSEAKDVVPAKALGMRAIRVCIEEPLATTSAADAVCASLAEAADRVRALSQAAGRAREA